MVERIKPVSWFRTNASEALRTIAEDREPYVITLDGEPQAVLQDIASYAATRDTLALLELVDTARGEAKAGRVTPFARVVEELRERRYEDR